MILLNVNKINWSLFTFQALLANDFILWVNFNTKNHKEVFNIFLKTKIPSALCIKSKMFLTEHLNQRFLKMPFFYENKNQIRLLLSGDAYMVICKSIEDLYKLISFFLKDKYFKNNKFNLSFKDVKYNEMYNTNYGFMSNIKIYKNIFPFNKYVLIFLQTIVSRLSEDNLYYNNIFLKITVVITFSLMLILIKMCLLLWSIFFMLIRSIFQCISYANKKSINS